MEVYKTWKVLVRGNEASLKEVEASVKNKFNWSWLEKGVESTLTINGKKEVKCYLGDFIRKIDKPGKALCTWCEAEINYGSGGARRLLEHTQTEKHKQVNTVIMF